MNKYPTFELWFEEQEGFEKRSERCYDDYEIHKSIGPYKNLRKWLETAFYAGRLQQRYTLSVEGDDPDLFIQFPEEVVKLQGWQEGTVLNWHDNGDGSWTIKVKA